ncbi:hypothetical protein HC031_20865 [Planosporangium thailandense]|uniref:Uncharacterized protein n=1 Tax=Planosporangium thailandense TaxID=765197 RepID=A0ABX0Y1B0_9ACTN|nr:hypothetical protein [Planosporangium thailandense]NJC72149.1 hypothetical protein [Planosporangium thailandense]
MPLPSRPTAPLGVREIAGWSLKVYGIAAHDPVPRSSLVAAALEHAADVLPATQPGHGFVIAHEARAWARHTDDPAAYLADVFSSR